MDRFDELVHRVNNLLGTIEVQVEVARADGTLAACEQALAFISESARKTRAEVRALTDGTGDDGPAA